jgi:hypothetical protein
MISFRNDLTSNRVRELLDYDAESGIFTWKIDRSIRVRAGDRAGSIQHDGYIKIGINGSAYFAHRLAWLWVTGEWPKEEIDHVNLVKDDNRFCNLREATRLGNVVNIPPRQRPTALPRGVSIARNGKFVAQIAGLHLGTFATPDEAGQVYNIAATDLYGEFYRGLET